MLLARACSVQPYVDDPVPDRRERTERATVVDPPPAASSRALLAAAIGSQPGKGAAADGGARATGGSNAR